MSHDPLRFSVVLLSAVVFIGLTAFNLYELFFSGEDLFGPRLGLEANTSATLEVYLLDTTPAAPAFFIWAALYIWNFLWVVYSFTTLCRSTSYGYLYMSPGGGIIPVAAYLCFSLAIIFLTAFLQVWKLYYIIYATPLFAICAVCLSLALIASYRRLRATEKALEIEGCDNDMWAVRVLLHNGVSLFAAWTIIATCVILLNASLVYRAGLDMELSGTISLAVLGALLLVYALLENTAFRAFTLYTLTPYLVVAVALGCSLWRNWTAPSPGRNAIFTAVLLGVDGVFLLLKLGVIIAVAVRSRPPDQKKYSF